MTFKSFIKVTSLFNKTKIERFKLTVLYYKLFKSIDEIEVKEIVNFLESNGFPKANITRLKNRIKGTRDLIKGSKKDNVKIGVKAEDKLLNEFPILKEKDETLVAEETILPNTLFMGTRGYIEKLCIQINGTYENNYYDACAVCMRRLLEVLLILTYQKSNKESDIQNSPNEYRNLSFIINFTKSNNQFHISKGVLDTMDEFRKVGNLSAHRIQYNCKPKEINDIKLNFRAAVEELMYKSGLK